MDDRRIAKSVTNGSAPAQVERMVYDGDNIALTFDGNGNQTHRYLYGPGVDQVLADENAQGKVLWALADNEGTVRDLVDSSGTVQNHIKYDSFGNITSQTNSAVDFRYGYTGQEFDKETGQYYYRARYYDPSTGGFISTDPIEFGGGDANLYRYVGNSPLNYTDPSGMFSCLLPHIPNGNPSANSHLAPWVPRKTKNNEEQRQQAIHIIQQNKDLICQVANKNRVNPDAIAGAILWEALENPYGACDIRTNIPGKIHPFNHPNLSQPQNLLRPSEAEIVEMEGLVPPLISKNLTFEESIKISNSVNLFGVDKYREAKLRDPKVAIVYIAAILNRAAQDYCRAQVRLIHQTDLVLVATAIDKRMKIVKSLLALGKLIEFNLIPPWRTDGIAESIQTIAKNLNLAITTNAARYLAEAIGNDTARIESELKLLATYADGEKIGIREVSELVLSQNQNSLQLADAIRQGDCTRVLTLLNILHARAESPLVICRTLQTQFRTWLWVKAATSSGRRQDAEIAKICHISNPKRVYFLKNDVQVIPIKSLFRALERLLDLEVALKLEYSQELMLSRLLEITRGLAH